MIAHMSGLRNSMSMTHTDSLAIFTYPWSH